MKKTNTELFRMINETNKKILNAMYSGNGNNETFKIESENFNTQYEEVLKRDLVEEYRMYCAEVA